MLRTTTALVFCILLFACSAVKLATPTQTDVDRAQADFPGNTLADLNQGKSLYEKKCTVCHGLKDPKKYSREKLDKIVPGMSKKANKKQEGAVNASQQELILKYMVTMSKS